VNVTWLVSFPTEEEETKAADPLNLWHGGNCAECYTS
jgi:hypothetical protein